MERQQEISPLHVSFGAARYLMQNRACCWLDRQLLTAPDVRRLHSGRLKRNYYINMPIMISKKCVAVFLSHVARHKF